MFLWLKENTENRYLYTDLWQATGFKIKKDNFSIFLNHYSIAGLRVIILKSFRFRDFPGGAVV